MTIYRLPAAMTIRGSKEDFITVDVVIEWPGINGTFSVQVPQRDYRISELWEAVRSEFARIATTLPSSETT